MAIPSIAMERGVESHETAGAFDERFVADEEVDVFRRARIPVRANCEAARKCMADGRTRAHRTAEREVRVHPATCVRYHF